MLADKITQDIAQAMKAKDVVRLSTLRMLSSAFNYERIAKQHDLSEDEELVVIKKEAKKRTDAIDALKEAQNKKTTSTLEEIKEKIEKEEKELLILKEFLPEEMDEASLVNVIDEVIKETGATSLAEMGKVIGAVKTNVGMKAEGSKIAEIVRSKLQ